MNTFNNIENLFHLHLKDIYNAESQMIDLFHKMEHAATNEALKSAFSVHLKMAKDHKKKLDKIGKRFKWNLKGESSAAAQGLVDETESSLDDNSDQFRDNGIVADMQRIESYEIAAYSTALQLAKSLNCKIVVEHLRQILKEEKEAARAFDKTVTTQFK